MFANISYSSTNETNFRNEICLKLSNNLLYYIVKKCFIIVGGVFSENVQYFSSIG